MSKVTFYMDQVKYDIKKFVFKDEQKEPHEIHFACPIEEFESQINEIFFEEHYAKGKVKKNMVIMDIGANVGSVCIYFRDWAKKIYAIEPEATNFECLTRNTNDLSNVYRFNCAILSYDGVLTLYGTEDSPPQSLFNGDIKEEVPCFKMDTFFTKEGIKKIDLLKIDAEGAEYYIFASDAFAKVADKIDNIIGEAHFITGVNPNMIYPILEQYGYKVEFLPFENMNRTCSLEDLTTHRIAKFKTMEQTMFFAHR